MTDSDLVKSTSKVEDKLQKVQIESDVVPARASGGPHHRIVIIQPWIRLGGAELVSVHLAHELERMGHNVSIVCAFLELEGMPEQAKRLQYRLPSSWLAEKMRKNRALFLILCPWVLLALVWKHSARATILNPHNFPSMWVASIVGRLKGMPVVWYCNEPPARVPLWNALRIGIPDFLGWFIASSWLDQIFAKGSATICTPSVMTQLQAKERYKREVKVLPVGIDADFFRKGIGSIQKSEFGFDGKYVLVCVGKLHPQKNQIVCLEAMREIFNQIPNSMLMLAGDGPSARELKSLSNRWGLADRVIFLGQVDSFTVRRLFQACDINLVPAVNQSWGFTAFEALCTGKVSVVSTSAGGATEILGENRIGLVSEPTGQAFARAILELHRDRSMYMQMSATGEEYVLRHLTWQAFAGKMIEVFDAEVDKEKPAFAGMQHGGGEHEI